MKILFSEKADSDFAEILEYNITRYGVEHAQKYHAFLIHQIERLKEQPHLGPSFEETQPCATFQ